MTRPLTRGRVEEGVVKVTYRVHGSVMFLPVAKVGERPFRVSIRLIDGVY